MPRPETPHKRQESACCFSGLLFGHVLALQRLRRGVVVDLQLKLATWAKATLFEVGGGDSALQRQEYYTRSWCWHVRGSPARAGSEWCSELKGEDSAGG
jgi:hypothetical protein